MNEEKKVPFKWEYGEETISLQLGMYANNQRLYIGMITHTEDGEEPFADMTVNLPGYNNLAPGDAIFFDWDLDGTADHVGIVIGTDGSRVYTVEGNSGDACKIKS